jgi:hypothetical protein
MRAQKKDTRIQHYACIKTLGLLPAEMLCEPGSGHPVKSEEFSEELCQQKFGRFRFKD